MSRFNGAAGKGASRTLRAVRRAEAETRQAAEHVRDEERRELIRIPERIKGDQTPRVELEQLTAEQLDALRDAMLRADALEAYRQTWTRGAR